MNIKGFISTRPKDKGVNMCRAKRECLKKVDHKPEECSPEQIRACHGEVAEHPCVSEKKSKEEG